MTGPTDDTLPETTEVVMNDGSASVPSHRVVELERGATVGRYVVLSRVGAGGMGVVYAAYDPELDRRVALKILMPRGGDRTAARARLLREAQALARLSHPNVVAVHDAGVDDERVFIAMEFVHGKTLRHWLKQSPARDDVLDAFAQAARGLSAAHAAGLVHRDFKPDNVMLGDDGRIRVMDFGLASAASDDSAAKRGEDEDPRGPEERSTSGDAFAMRLTRTGAAIGTPAYMAPEQFAGMVTDARTDQFSFCVALYEALYGQRPFAAKTLHALSVAVLSGQLQDPPSDARVPAHLARAVRTGLAREPRDRHPDLGPLLTALTHDPKQARSRIGRLVVAAGVVGGAAFAVGRSQPTEVVAAAPICADLDAAIQSTWNPQRATALVDHLAAQVSYGASVGDRVVERLDTWRDAWVEMRTETCAATRLRGEQSESAMELRNTCLDARHQRLSAALEVLEAADAAVAREAMDVVDGLPSLDRCADLAALRAAVPPPEDADARAANDQAERELDRVEANMDAGKFDAALEHARAAQAAVDGHDIKAANARIRARMGDALERLGDHEKARTELNQAYLDALEVGDDATAARAAASLVLIVGDRLAKPEDGERWARQAIALSRRPPGYPATEARAQSGWGLIHSSRGDGPKAIARQEAALAAHERAGAGERTAAAATLDNLGLAYGWAGRRDEADQAHRRALEIFEASLGPDHPEVGYPLYNLALSRLMQGHADEALELIDRGHAVWSKALGDEHELTIRALELQGMARADLGDLEAAEAAMSKARAALAKSLGEEHPSVASADGNLAIVYRRLGRLEDARAVQERGLAVQRKVLGPDHPVLAFSMDELATIVGLSGDRTAALATVSEAATLAEKALGPDHPDTRLIQVNRANALRKAGRLRAAAAEYDALMPAIAEEADPGDKYAVGLAGQGLTHLALGDQEAAIKALEAATAIAPNDATALPLARARFGLARAIQAADPNRAKTLATQAEAAFAESPTTLAHGDLTDVRAWLAR
jgi:tetratricopeptide (TPR) repeat protein/predicted Ser/Thr protein kinase